MAKGAVFSGAGDWVGACVVTLDPTLALLKAHVLQCKRITPTTPRMLAKGNRDRQDLFPR